MRYIVAFKSRFNNENDFMVFDRETRQEHRVRQLDDGSFPMVSGRQPTEGETAAVIAFRKDAP